jgi:hypothetical protein
MSLLMNPTAWRPSNNVGILGDRNITRGFEETKNMRAQLFVGLSAVLVFAATVDAPARAENEFDVTVAAGQVTVQAKGDWHINKDFPWKLVIGDTKLDKSKFALSEKTATVSNAPKGTGKLKGAVCSKDACHTLEKDVTIQ